MAHVPRCLVPDLDADELALDASARHHVERVLRVRSGEALLLVDGRGGLAHARLVAPGRVRIESRDVPAPADACPVTLAVAMPRLPRLEWLVEKACELGVARVALLETQHGEHDVNAAKLLRLERLADEALLQCGRLHRMPVDAPAPLANVLRATAAGAGAADAADVWLASTPAELSAASVTPGSAQAPDSARLRGFKQAPGSADEPMRGAGRALVALVGPEGGFTAAEQELACAQGARRVSLGATVLRVETAALAMAVLAAGSLR